MHVLPFEDAQLSPDDQVVAVRRGIDHLGYKIRWEHTIRDDRDVAAHMDYTHLNPVAGAAAMKRKKTGERF
jgi:hypothetical protein